MRLVVVGGLGVAALTFVACGGNAPLATGDAGLPDAALPDTAVTPDLGTGMGIEPLAACGAFSACGGDATGSWKSVRTCSDIGSGMSGLQLCPQARFDLSKMQVDTMLDLRSDGSYTSTTTTSGKPSVIVPESCLTGLMIAGQPVQCVRLGLYLSILLDQNQMGQMNPISKIDCNIVGSECACDVVFKSAPTPVVETGTWRTENNQLYTKTADRAESGSEYCVAANQLRMKTTIATGLGGLMGGSAGPEVVVVLQH